MNVNVKIHCQGKNTLHWWNDFNWLRELGLDIFLKEWIRVRVSGRKIFMIYNKIIL